ncbi:unnamed protein product [Symbiodinium pilosum]|uniref:Nucleotide-diphospho-sugar transferase domain-containing protein n=1 Tax=Symbiodinium pilosum TaxID=2952 RepID=A0A812WSJ1_SYMPI|nr:unnamed protein product [Symbiodinium pilosum]
MLGRTLILPQNSAILQDCSNLVDSCLPVLSVFPELAKYTLLAFAAMLGVNVLYADLDTYWAQNPFRLLPRHDDLDAADVARQHVGGAVVYGGSHAQ